MKKKRKKGLSHLEKWLNLFSLLRKANLVSVRQGRGKGKGKENEISNKASIFMNESL